MADKKKSKPKKSVEHPSDVGKIWAEKEGLIPSIVIDKKTGKPDRRKTFNLIKKSIKSKWASGRSPELRKIIIDASKRRGSLRTAENEYLDRVAKAETEAKIKKATGPELTMPRKKRKGAAKGALIGPKYRHSNKDYRKGGLFK